jgi:hypothetical protein
MCTGLSELRRIFLITVHGFVFWWKRVELLHELVPNSAILALLVNPKYPSAESEISETRAASTARTLRRWNERTGSQSVAPNSSPDRVYLFGKAMLAGLEPHMQKLVGSKPNWRGRWVASLISSTPTEYSKIIPSGPLK